MRRRSLHVARTVREVLRWREGVVRDVVGLVPTMGALHAGHESLLVAARRECATVASSIFVNPTQFGPGEDLEQYPRQIEKDLEVMESHGVDLVFAPVSAKELYPLEDGFAVRSPERFGRIVGEGAARPGHFDGVATVCTKLFNLVRPNRAYFGQKDALQCVVIRQLAIDLMIPVEVRVEPTKRDADGLALSSRNAYLSEEQRRAAPVLYRALCAAEDAFRDGERRPETLVDKARSVLAGEPLVTKVDYISVARYDDMSPINKLISEEEDAIISLAVRLGDRVRLLDNAPLLIRHHRQNPPPPRSS